MEALLTSGPTRAGRKADSTNAPIRQISAADADANACTGILQAGFPCTTTRIPRVRGTSASICWPSTCSISTTAACGEASQEKPGPSCQACSLPENNTGTRVCFLSQPHTSSRPRERPCIPLWTCRELRRTDIPPTCGDLRPKTRSRRSRA